MRSFNDQVQEMAEKDRLTADKKYKRALAALPAPGYGTGLHGKLLGVASLGVRAGVSPATVAADLRRSVPTGERVVSDVEIRQAVERASAGVKM